MHLPSCPTRAERRWMSVNDMSKYEGKVLSWDVANRLMGARGQLNMEVDVKDSAYCVDYDDGDDFFDVDASVVISGMNQMTVRGRYNFQIGLIIHQEYLQALRATQRSIIHSNNTKT